MPNNTYRLWSSLSSQERVDAITKVAAEAGTNKSFRDACYGPDGQKTVQDFVEVTFDPYITLRFIPNKDTAEKEVILKLPTAPLEADARLEDYWLCTYVDYRKQR